MSKTATIDALMESAMQSFSREGYEGASLRDIARNADVPLSTIHLYFGSKSELFSAVRSTAWAEVDRERHALLDQAVAANGEAPTPVSQMVHALAYPVVRRALSKDPRDVAQIFLLRFRTPDDLKDAMLEVADRSVSRWIEAMTRSYPLLTRPDLVWAFSFVVGAIYSWQLIDHRYDRLIGPEAARSADDLTADIVAFCCSGIQAIADRRTNQV
jgi:AcrR family transcriptional regulator